MKMESLQKTMKVVSDILDIDQNIEGKLYLEQFIKNIAITLNIKGTSKNRPRII
jgi:hypothetical protein